MDDWQLFADSRFSLQLKSPLTTPQRHLIDRIEIQRDTALRVRFVSRDSQELYFEVTKYTALPPQVEYEQHRAELTKRFPEFNMTELRAVHWKSLPAHEYSFALNQERRSVLLIERDDATYRILYDPRASLNLHILSTVEWIA